MVTMLSITPSLKIKALPYNWQKDTIARLSEENTLKDQLIKEIVSMHCGDIDWHSKTVSTAHSGGFSDFFKGWGGGYTCKQMLQKVSKAYGYNNMQAPSFVPLSSSKFSHNQLVTMTLREAEMNECVRDWCAAHGQAIPLKHMTEDEAIRYGKVKEWCSAQGKSIPIQYMTEGEALMNERAREWYIAHGKPMPIQYMTESEALSCNKWSDWKMYH